MSLVLGCNLGHDGAVAVVANGRLIGAISRERLSRKKKDTGVTQQMVDYVLDMVGAKLTDVDVIAFAGYDYAPDNEVKVFVEGKEYTNNLYDMDFHKGGMQCQISVNGVRRNAMYVHHHLSHCASAFYTSPFEKAACFSLDASGRNAPEASSLFAYGQGTKVLPFYCPGLMIGNEYSEITPRLGLGPGLFKAGSLMGLAAYGKISVHSDAISEWFEKSWYDRGLQPSEQAFIERMWVQLSGRSPVDWIPEDKKDSKEAMNIAATLQNIFERVIVEYAEQLFYETSKFNDKNICLSGGSFLNCNVNTAIKDRTHFKNVHLFPGCGDDGTAVGAALLIAHFMMNEPRQTYTPSEIAYLGFSYPTPTSILSQPKLDLDTIAKRLENGSIVAWYQGRSEFGPRALGNRSILADPRSETHRDLINSKVKHREWFRPFAPSVLSSHSNEWFDFDGESPFMLHTARVKKPELVPAITHVDGTARQQTVFRPDNPQYYDLIEAFRKRTGVPMLLNTSLNGNSEPLVETPEDAIRFFEQTPDVDTLVINDRMIFKAPLVQRSERLLDTQEAVG